MRRSETRACAAALMVAVCTALMSGDAGAFGLRGGVVANGGDSPAGGGYVVWGTVGQAAIGSSTGASHVLCHGFWCFGGPGVVAVDEGPTSPPIPTVLRLGHPTPNPTKGAVTLQLDLPEEASVDLAVYDLTGRKVAQIVAGSLPAGIHRPRWDTFDAQGGPLGQGIYFARLVVNGQRVAQRSLVIVR